MIYKLKLMHYAHSDARVNSAIHLTEENLQNKFSPTKTWCNYWNFKASNLEDQNLIAFCTVN